MVLHYPKENATEDDEWIDTYVPETFISYIKDDVIQTAPMEGLEWRENFE